jgi:hypothetical protein
MMAVLLIKMQADMVQEKEVFLRRDQYKLKVE